MVRLPGDLTEARPPRDRPVREIRCQGQVTGRSYRIPVSRFRWGLKRVAAGTRNPRLAVQAAA